MIHYNVWFDLRDKSEEADDLGIIHALLSELQAAGSITGFQLLQNSATDPAKTKMRRFQALIAFEDDAQFSATFSAQAARGVNTGLHGRVTSLVSDLGIEVEVFRQIASFNPPADPAHLC